MQSFSLSFFYATLKQEPRLKNTTLSHKKGRTNTRYPTN
jgi:hypothetical protein